MSYKTEFQSNNADLQAILKQVNSLPESPLPTLSNPAATNNIESGYEAIDSEGNKLTGTLTLAGMLPTMTNPAGAADVANGKQFVDATGAVVSGTLNAAEVVTGTTKSLTIEAAKGKSNILIFLNFKMSDNGNYDISGDNIFVCGGVINGKSLGWTANLYSSPYSYPISASWNSSTGKLSVYGSLGYFSTGAFEYRYIAW